MRMVIEKISLKNWGHFVTQEVVKVTRLTIGCCTGSGFFVWEISTFIGFVAFPLEWDTFPVITGELCAATTPVGFHRTCNNGMSNQITTIIEIQTSWLFSFKVSVVINCFVILQLFEPFAGPWALKLCYICSKWNPNQSIAWVKIVSFSQKFVDFCMHM